MKLIGNIRSRAWHLWYFLPTICIWSPSFHISRVRHTSFTISAPDGAFSNTRQILNYWLTDQRKAKAPLCHGDTDVSQWLVTSFSFFLSLLACLFTPRQILTLQPRMKDALKLTNPGWTEFTAVTVWCVWLFLVNVFIWAMVITKCLNAASL